MEAGTDTLDRVACELVAESVRAGHEVRIRVAGSSMVPALWPGDELLVRALGLAEPSPGDLLLFVHDGRLCTHRLVGQVEEAGAPRLITRGDAALRCDPPKSSEEILGAVVSVFRDGHQVPIASSRPGRLLSFSIRHSEFLRRVVLKIHAIRRQSWTVSETRCRV